jgi:hypothetical protein
MSAMGGAVRRLLVKIPLVSQLWARLNDLTSRIAVLEGKVRDLSNAPDSSDRDWVQSTVVTNLKDKIAALEERLAESAGDDDSRVARQRVRDLEDYIRLGGHVLPR